MTREYWAVKVIFYDDERPVEHWFLDFAPLSDVPYYTLLVTKRWRFASSGRAHDVAEGIAKLDATLAPRVVHVRVVRAP